ncbi:MAG: DUF4446 family protein [Lachnospiraceae bacterium]|nr:DUF4446 family protein [Lachnospiraceae bacterium]
MNQSLMNQIGLGNLDISYLFIILFVLIIILSAITVWQLLENRKLKKKYEKFLQGKNAKSLESQIIQICEEQQYLRDTTDKNSRNISRLFKKHESAFQKIGIVKYDAFKEMGGKLSFCLALLDENNNGFVLNSVHSSDGCYSYTKRIRAGECDILLGDEEKRALEKAISGTKI